MIEDRGTPFGYLRDGNTRTHVPESYPSGRVAIDYTEVLYVGK
jgi:hypothetical protein